jgi:hypothetical protein
MKITHLGIKPIRKLGGEYMTYILPYRGKVFDGVQEKGLVRPVCTKIGRRDTVTLVDHIKIRAAPWGDESFRLMGAKGGPLKGY